MSNEALTWAKNTTTGSASAKAVLLVMADDARAPDQLCFKTVQTITKETELNRKTVMPAIKRLIELGLITDTGDRRGATGSIPVYRLNITSGPKNDTASDAQADEKSVPLIPSSGPNIGTAKQYQNRTNPDEAVPVFPEAVPVFPSSGPNFGTQNPLDTNETNTKKNRALSRISLDELPEQISPQVALAFIEHRKLAKPALTQYAFDLAMKEAAKASEIGITPDQAINETIQAGWKGIKIEWLKNRIARTGGQDHAAGRSNRSANHRAASPIERRIAARTAAQDFRQDHRSAVGQDVSDVRPPLDGEFWRGD